MQKNIKCLIQACDRLGINYQFIDAEKNFLRLMQGSTPSYFQLNKTPFNSEVMYGICKDKMHTYQLLQSAVRMPLTLSFLDWNIEAKYQNYLHYQNKDEVITQIEADISYPLVIKKNKGALGANVHLCQNRVETINALKTIFNKASKDYDYIALCQQYIPTKEEYRLVCSFGEPVLAYRRGNASEFNRDYWKVGEAATLIEDKQLIRYLHDFISPIYSLIDFGFVGFDIIKGTDNQLYLIEINASPKFDHIIDSSGEECVVRMYTTSLKHFLKKINLLLPD